MVVARGRDAFDEPEGLFVVISVPLWTVDEVVVVVVLVLVLGFSSVGVPIVANVGNKSVLVATSDEVIGSSSSSSSSSFATGTLEGGHRLVIAEVDDDDFLTYPSLLLSLALVSTVVFVTDDAAIFCSSSFSSFSITEGDLEAGGCHRLPIPIGGGIGGGGCTDDLMECGCHRLPLPGVEDDLTLPSFLFAFAVVSTVGGLGSSMDGGGVGEVSSVVSGEVLIFGSSCSSTTADLEEGGGGQRLTIPEGDDVDLRLSISLLFVVVVTSVGVSFACCSTTVLGLGGDHRLPVYVVAGDNDDDDDVDATLLSLVLVPLNLDTVSVVEGMVTVNGEDLLSIDVAVVAAEVVATFTASSATGGCLEGGHRLLIPEEVGSEELALLSSTLLSTISSTGGEILLVTSIRVVCIS